MNKQDYHVKEDQVAEKANGVLWIIRSTRTSVIMYEATVIEITPNHGVREYYDNVGNRTKISTSNKKYLLQESPYGIDIDDETNVGEEHGYAGSFWSWSFFASPDKDVATKLYEDEQLRVQTKYGMIF